MQLRIEADAKTRDYIRGLGRTEDVKISPNGRRLAVAAYTEDKIVLFDFSCDRSGRETFVRLNRPLELHSGNLRRPHGLSWIDDETLAVANRMGGALILGVGDNANPDVHRRDAPTLCDLGATANFLDMPGSISCRRLTDRLYEILICDNRANQVSRHFVVKTSGFEALSSRILVRKELNVPDGVCQSRDGAWLAVSNHFAHAVWIYANSAPLCAESEPNGRLLDIAYPHGVTFSACGRYAFVTDAGLPFVCFYASPDGDWSGDRQPIRKIEVVSPEAFVRGHVNPEEGGAKGIDVTQDGQVMIVSCEEEPLAFFDLGDLPSVEPAPEARTGERPYASAPLETALDELAGEITNLRAQIAALHDSVTTAHGRYDALKADVKSLVDGRFWRASKPLRKILGLGDRPSRILWRRLAR